MENGDLVAELGFEPRQTESESVVLPLHNSAVLITATSIISLGPKMSSIFRHIFIKNFILEKLFKKDAKGERHDRCFCVIR